MKYAMLNRKEVGEIFSKKTPPWGVIGYPTYKRSYAQRIKEENRTEEWWESMLRCVNSIQEHVMAPIDAPFTDSQLRRLYQMLFDMKIFLSGRKMWQLGMKLVREGFFDSCSNCWVVTIRDIKSLLFLFEQSLLGGGVTLNLLEVYNNPKLFPPIKKQCIIKRDDINGSFIVPDDRKGWVRLVEKLLTSYFYTGESFTYSLAKLRKAGEFIEGFGGYSCGPDPVEKMVRRICGIFLNADTWLTADNFRDICNIFGALVNETHRRNAQLVLGSEKDNSLLLAKRWDIQDIPVWRSQSNNTILCTKGELPTNPLFWQTYEATGEPLGIYNRDLARTVGCLNAGEYANIPDPEVEATNPCQPGWATVLTPDGIKTFDEISVGSMIWSKQGWTKVVRKEYTGQKQVFHYMTPRGDLFATSEHRVVVNGVKVEVGKATFIDACPTMLEDTNLPSQKILFVQDMGIFPVYDITVDNTSHTYWSGGVDVSNCGEQNLKSYEDCLKGSFTLPYLTSMQEAYEGAFYLYMVCKGIRKRAKYLYPETEELAKKNMRMGLSLGGFLEPHGFSDHNLLSIYQHLRVLDARISESWKVPHSIRLTDIQPEGTKSCLWGMNQETGERYLVAPGAHPTYFRYGIRRIRMSKEEPVAKTLANAGFNVAPVEEINGELSKTMVVVEFPARASQGAVVSGEMSAIAQLEIQKRLQSYWADANVSMTCYYTLSELPEIKRWLAANFKHHVKSVSFLQKSDAHGFKQAPFEEISREKYLELQAKVTPVFSILGDTTTDLTENICHGNNCPIR